MGRFAPITTHAPVPTGLMIVAGLATPFVPLALLIPTLMLFETNGEGLPLRAELFLTFGAVPGLILMIPTLVVAHQLNRRGRNGWAMSLGAGALIGLLTGVVWDAGHLRGFALGSIAIGLLYAALFWALSHGLASYAAWRAA